MKLLFKLLAITIVAILSFFVYMFVLWIVSDFLSYPFEESTVKVLSIILAIGTALFLVGDV